jgi:hypothetical protein
MWLGTTTLDTSRTLGAADDSKAPEAGVLIGGGPEADTSLIGCLCPTQHHNQRFQQRAHWHRRHEPKPSPSYLFKLETALRLHHLVSQLLTSGDNLFWIETGNAVLHVTLFCFVFMNTQM